MIYRILRKVGLGSTVLNISKSFLKAGRSLPSPAEAMALLQAFSPDPGNSCLCSNARGKSENFELDIIIPAYNVEKYIKRCIDSVLSQETDCRYRMIVVDDGSRDGTADIIDGYADDGRIMIIHQENRGLSGARNAGLALSTAEYVMFLDSDDSLPAGAIQNLISCARKNGADMVEGAFNSTDTQGKVLSSAPHAEGLLECRKDFFGYACMKIIRKDLLNGLRFPEGYWYEDSIMAQIIYPLAESRAFKSYGISDPVYNYTVNPKGISHTSRKRPKCIDSLWLTLSLFRDREKLGIKKDQEYYEYILNMLILSYRRAENQSEDVKKAMFVLWQDFLEREFADFDTDDSAKKILQQAVRGGNFPLYSAACKLI